jgi:hypothetical protein
MSTRRKHSRSKKMTRKMKGGSDRNSFSDSLSEELDRVAKEADDMFEPYQKSQNAYYSGFGYTFLAIVGVTVGLVAAKMIKK